jgi:hypothetical protein
MLNLNETLVEVRKAFRLLNLFSKRILSLMEYIGEALEVEYVGGRTVFSADTPKRMKGSLDIWAWDYYNLYFYEFYFSNNKSWISILLQSDTGLWDILDDNNDYYDELEKKAEDISKFNSPEKSQTRLLFVTGTKERDENDITLLCEKNLNRDVDEEIVIDLNRRNKLYCKIFTLDNFIDEETTIITLEKYLDFLKNKNFNKITLKKYE